MVFLICEYLDILLIPSCLEHDLWTIFGPTRDSKFGVGLLIFVQFVRFS